VNVVSQGKNVRVSRPEPNVVEFKTTAGATYVLSATAAGVPPAPGR